MSWKMFGQIVLLIVIWMVLTVGMRCAIKKCPIMSKWHKSAKPSASVPIQR